MHGLYNFLSVFNDIYPKTGDPDVMANAGDQNNEAANRGNPSFYRGSKVPNYDPSESIDQYLSRVDFWCELEGITTEREKFLRIAPYLPGHMFREVSNFQLSNHPNPYGEMKRILLAAFGMHEFERVRKLTDRIQIGDRKPGDVLRELQDLGTTADERILKTLWLQRLPPEMAAALSTSIDLPINDLRSMANSMHSFMQNQPVAQVTTEQVRSTQNTRPTSSDFVLGELLSSIKELVSVVRDQHASTISAISRGIGEHRSRSVQRDSFRVPRFRSQSRDSELDDQGRCWYHWKFGERAHKCKTGCTFASNKSY